MAFEGTYSHPAATFADRLLVDGQMAGKVNRFRRSAPRSEQKPGEPWRMYEPFYVGYIGTDAVPGEHPMLAEAQRAVEAAVSARGSSPAVLSQSSGHPVL